jgi:hypothetical protein
MSNLLDKLTHHVRPRVAILGERYRRIVKRRGKLKDDMHRLGLVAG